MVGFQTVEGSVRRAGGGELDDGGSVFFRITFWLPSDLIGDSERLVTRSSMERCRGWLEGKEGWEVGADADSWDSS